MNKSTSQILGESAATGLQEPTGQVEALDEDALSRECAKHDPDEEQIFADMGLSTDFTGWPAY